MKRRCVIISVIITIVLIIFLSTFFTVLSSVPTCFRYKNVCFIIPELTWSYSPIKLKNICGTPINTEYDFAIKGEKYCEYLIEYAEKQVVLITTSKIFPLNAAVYEYFFTIKCLDKTKAEEVFFEIYNKMITENKNEPNFEIDKTLQDEYSISFSVDYGATGIYYELFN